MTLEAGRVDGGFGGWGVDTGSASTHPDGMTRGRAPVWLRSSGTLVAMVVFTMVLCSWLLREVIIAERPVEEVAAAVGALVAVAALFVAVRWIERATEPPRRS